MVYLPTYTIKINYYKCRWINIHTYIICIYCKYIYIYDTWILCGNENRGGHQGVQTHDMVQHLIDAQPCSLYTLRHRFLVEFPTDVGFPPFTFHKNWSVIVQCQGFFWCNGNTETNPIFQRCLFH